MKLTTFLAFLIVSQVTVACAINPIEDDDLYCGFVETRTPLKSNLWDSYASDDSVGDMCVSLFHTERDAPLSGENVCIKKSEIQNTCSDDDGSICMAECDGNFVNQSK